MPLFRISTSPHLTIPHHSTWKPTKKQKKKFPSLYLLGIPSLVRMVLDRRLPIRLLQIVLRNVLRHPKHLIVPRVVALLRRSPEHLLARFLTPTTTTDSTSPAGISTLTENQIPIAGKKPPLAGHLEIGWIQALGRGVYYIWGIVGGIERLRLEVRNGVILAVGLVLGKSPEWSDMF